jgi:hypothetical protein
VNLLRVVVRGSAVAGASAGVPATTFVFGVFGFAAGFAAFLGAAVFFPAAAFAMTVTLRV